MLLTNFPKSFLKSQTLETGLSDFHKLTPTVLKINYKKQKPLVVTYRDYKNLSNENYRAELLNIAILLLLIFIQNFFICWVSMHQLRKDTSRANQKNFIDKKLNPAIMVRSKLRNKFLKLKTEENRLAYANQRNCCVKLLQQKSDNTLKT